ncbi:sulfatase-like hydrolase/transferase [Nocardia sp. alder85J]|uniref:sulfatase-like hydrolase/transferase n=1 Tax=Nocardia sp. alder85J TaxID=2862949 RepID=UPI001CD33206|nr:sulfatase-like hydrolase/transferase [Nocardia sp. alder85J]MCX4094350.1 sulfatase-like hydrolase/transferase [Nocardia sp. alder85J]
MPLSRRGFLAGGAAFGAAATATAGAAAPARADTDPARPNILVIIVDEMRAPMWFPAPDALDAILPNLARIRRRAVSFEGHYTAADDCTPARGALVTGLYSHQTGCLITSQSTLSPQFPTWGSMLRQVGYETTWWGKWHLGPHSDSTPGGLEPYGFAGGTYPSPNGAPNQGLNSDPHIADQFIGWLDGEAGRGPWCSTVSLVNPHDIQWWPRFTRNLQSQTAIPRWLTDLPGNYETPEQLAAKPRLQTALIQASAATFGVAEYHTPDAAARWIDMRNLYLWLQQQVDIQIGRVLDALEARPEVAASTVVVFTADHGDYAGSHGLHGKGGAAYEEAIRVPLYIADPRGDLTPGGRAATRAQLTSSVDIAPLLLTIATGGNAWRADPGHEHLSARCDLTAICRDPGAAGRPFAVHATDEITLEEAALLFDRDAPGHVAAVRTAAAKYASYTHWRDGTTDADPGEPAEYELYDYTGDDRDLELQNRANADSALRSSMSGLLDHALRDELQAPLPPYLAPAREEGLADYHDQTAKLLAIGETVAHALGSGGPR